MYVPRFTDAVEEYIRLHPGVRLQDILNWFCPDVESVAAYHAVRSLVCRGIVAEREGRYTAV